MAGLLATARRPAGAADPPDSAPGGEASIAAIEARGGGRLGVFALDTGSGRTLAHRADERFLMCSTFKGPLGAMALSHLDAGTETVQAVVPYGARDLVVASPVTSLHVGQGGLTVGASAPRCSSRATTPPPTCCSRASAARSA